MTGDSKIQTQTVVAAVSGGVDSVVMLHQLVQQKQRPTVAHFDHGIREDSGADARFVEGLAQKYNLPFELGQAKLGPKASEEAARKARHAFLHSVRKKHQTEQIATAHHHEDVIETAIINLLRGTGRRGMSSLQYTTLYSRPLIKWSKKQIYEYATEHRLEWVEDPTNVSDTYLRNRVRHRLVPLMKQRGVYAKFEQVVGWFYGANSQLNQALQQSFNQLVERTPDHMALPLKILEKPQVGAELIHLILRELKAREVDAAEIKRLVKFVQEAKPGDRFNQFPPLTITKSKGWLLFEM